MGEDLKGFGGTAASLARNPLGIIALFIVMVYGLASLVTAFGGSLAAATAKGEAPASGAELDKIVEVVRAARPAAHSAVDGWRNRILWVDDRPENNVLERQAFETMGLKFTLALSTDDALEALTKVKFAAIISDMGRREGPREGYVLLDRLRREGDQTPLFFHAASSSPEHKRETREHGGQGSTSNAQELFEMVTRAVIQRQAA